LNSAPPHNEGPRFFPSLEGIRGYAFLAVFLIHYYDYTLIQPASPALRVLHIIENQMWFLVPIFFVLSGFLITRILMRTLDREGFFRVFYARRALRILPLYYLVIGGVTVYTLLRERSTFHASNLLFFVYLGNATGINIGTRFFVGHLWSLAVEEQFYLLWPLAIWFLRSERAVLNFSYWLVGACTLFRVAWPLWGLHPGYAYFITPTRVDGIVLGAILAFHYERTKHWERYVLAAKVGIPVLLAGTLGVTLLDGFSFPAIDLKNTSYLGIAYCIPAMNFIGLGLVILALTPNSVVAKVCSQPTICKVGRLSYGLYVFHDLYLNFLYEHTMPRLVRHMSATTAHAVFTVLGFTITLGLSMATYWLIEEQAMRLKERFRYGAIVKRSSRFPWGGRRGAAADAGE
jgi:peptidoglycan/LPS O-acetylase OafA/YrhL